MGTRVNRIETEFVLKSLADKELPISIRIAGSRYETTLLDVDAKRLVLAPIEEELPIEGQPVDVYFDFQNSAHTFTTEVLEARDTGLTVRLPQGLYKSLQRQFERVRLPDGIVVTFGLAGQPSLQLSFPSIGRSIQRPQPPPAGFDDSSVKSLADDFNLKVKNEASEGKIVMMREKAPASFEERIIQATGKALWIPDTQGDYPAHDPLEGEVLLTRSEIIEFERDSGTEAYLIVSRLSNRLYEKQRDGITSELHWPLVYGEFFVGYLHVVNRSGNGEINRNLLEWIQQFSQILSHSLETHGYFTGGDRPRPYEAEVIDLSASGMLFVHRNQDIYRQLLLHSDIQIGIRVRNRRMSVEARVVRKIADNDQVYVALRFLDVKPEDFRFLYETLYNRPFDPAVFDSESGLMPNET